MATTVEDRIKASLFLCGLNIDEWGSVFSDEWLEKWNDTIQTKWEFICSVFPGSDPQKIFLWINELSDGIDPVLFPNSHLRQPDLFLRIRPGRQKTVLQKLSDQRLPYQLIADSCLALTNASKIDAVLDIDKEVVVQDYSSQQIAGFFQLITYNLQPITLWDCCAASGGKSLLACDLIKNIQLTVSDVRPSILRNLKSRFENAGIKNYHSFVGDIAGDKFKIHPHDTVGTKFKIILCDAPCSGSGTWGRTPEQLYFFKEEKINEYAALQKKIVANVIPYIENGGHLLYITCSVFKKENEEVVAFIQNNPKLELIKMELLKGYDKKADSMFAALFRLRD